jgi:hypothetical protein
MYLNLNIVIFGGGSGWGLAPTRGHIICYIYVTMPVGKWRARGCFKYSLWFHVLYSYDLLLHENARGFFFFMVQTVVK